MEVTKWLKPSISVSRIGDSASVQAATRWDFEVKHIFYTTLHFLHSSCSTWNPVSSPRPTLVLRPTRTGPVKVGAVGLLM